MKIIIESSDFEKLPKAVVEGLLDYIGNLKAPSSSVSTEVLTEKIPSSRTCAICTEPGVHPYYDGSNIDNLEEKRRFYLCQGHFAATKTTGFFVGEISIEGGLALLSKLQIKAWNGLQALSSGILTQNCYEKDLASVPINALSAEFDAGFGRPTRAFNGFSGGISRATRSLCKHTYAFASSVRLFTTRATDKEMSIVITPQVARTLSLILEDGSSESVDDLRERLRKKTKYNSSAIEAYKDGLGQLRFFQPNKQSLLQRRNCPSGIQFNGFTKLYVKNIVEHYVAPNGEIVEDDLFKATTTREQQ